VDIFGDPTAITFTANDPTLLEVSIKEYTPYGARLYLKTLKRGTPILQARIGGPGGDIVAQQEIDEFTIDGTVRTNVVTAQDAGVATCTLTFRPWVNDLSVRLSMFAHTATFSGGATEVRTNTSIQSEFHVVQDPDTGETVAKYAFDIEFPRDEQSYCMDISIDQHSRHGTEVGDERLNGDRCDLDVDLLYFAWGEDKEKELRIRCNKKGKAHQPHVVKTVDASLRTDPTMANGKDKVNCPDPVGVKSPAEPVTDTPPVVKVAAGTADGKVKPTDPGYYDIEIDGTAKGFERKIAVVQVKITKVPDKQKLLATGTEVFRCEVAPAGLKGDPSWTQTDPGGTFTPAFDKDWKHVKYVAPANFTSPSNKNNACVVVAFTIADVTVTDKKPFLITAPRFFSSESHGKTVLDRTYPKNNMRFKSNGNPVLDEFEVKITYKIKDQFNDPVNQSGNGNPGVYVVVRENLPDGWSGARKQWAVTNVNRLEKFREGKWGKIAADSFTDVCGIAKTPLGVNDPLLAANPGLNLFVDKGRFSILDPALFEKDASIFALIPHMWEASIGNDNF